VLGLAACQGWIPLLPWLRWEQRLLRNCIWQQCLKAQNYASRFSLFFIIDSANARVHKQVLLIMTQGQASDASEWEMARE
jgi:hypothetical protein